MDKYLVIPTKIIGENGFVKTIDGISCNGDHSGGSSSGECKFTDERNKALQQATQKSELALNLADEMYNQWDIGGRIDDVKKIANEAKNTANIAHNTAISILEELDVVEKTAEIAEDRAIEAYNSLHSLNGDYEALKARVEDLEETNGQASEPIVGKSKMGYVPDFTEFGLSNKHEVYVELGDEGRSLTFDSNTVLGDVVEELMYCTATGITNHHNRLTALENGSGGSSSSGETSNVDVLGTELTFKPMSMMSDESLKGLGVPEDQYNQIKQQEQTITIQQAVAESTQYASAMFAENNYVVKPKLQDHETRITQNNNTIAGHTSSIQSLDTRTGSHTASIGQLENKMTDVDNYSKANRTMITGVATSLSNTQSDVSNLKTAVGTIPEGKTDHETRIQTLESKTSGDTILATTTLGDGNTLGGLYFSYTNEKDPNKYNPKYFYDTDATTLMIQFGPTRKLIEVLEQIAFAVYTTGSAHFTHLNELDTKVNTNNSELSALKNAMVADLNYIWSTLKDKYPDLPDIGTGGGATDWNVSGVAV